MLAPKIRSLGLVVLAETVVDVLLPDPDAATSTGLTGSAPLYSTMRTSALVAAFEKVTVTVLVAAAAALMFFA